jgi:hypothetical protein
VGAHILPPARHNSQDRPAPRPEARRETISRPIAFVNARRHVKAKMRTAAIHVTPEKCTIFIAAIQRKGTNNADPGSLIFSAKMSYSIEELFDWMLSCPANLFFRKDHAIAENREAPRRLRINTSNRFRLDSPDIAQVLPPPPRR